MALIEEHTKYKEQKLKQIFELIIFIHDYAYLLEQMWSSNFVNQKHCNKIAFIFICESDVKKCIPCSFINHSEHANVTCTTTAGCQDLCNQWN